MVDFTDEDEVQAGFEHFRENGFPYPVLTRYEIINIFRRLQQTKAKINKARPNLFNTKSRIITTQSVGAAVLCNYFHPHIWESHAVNMRSSIQSFGIDKSLQKVMKLCLTYDGKIAKKHVLLFLRTVNGTQICSNFRPQAAKAVYNYFKPRNVLDMSAGYGGRLLGFLASHCKGSYTGIDPSKKSCIGNRNIAKELGATKRVKIICSPFEDVGVELPKVELAFTSTPYFVKEVYEEGNPKQSRERYPEYRDWLNGFLKPMMRKTRRALTSKGTMALNIANVVIKNKSYSLVNDTIRIAKRNGFTYTEKLEMGFSSFGKGNKKRKMEPVLIFKKK